MSRTLLLALAASAWSFAASLPDIKFTDTRLENGLRLIVSEDHDAPVFSICVTYNVGSRDERKGRTGFAHLFEHMMFKGSDKVGPGEHFFLIFNNGGNMNGTTNQDRTNYFETLPANQLDLALFLESDRMRSLAITKENLDNQRHAVQEERRLGIDNRPYGRTYEKILELSYQNFAYKHSTIGSMDDLNAGTVEDVREFFKTYYAPNNAVVSIVGAVKTSDVTARVRKYFGNIPRQKPPQPVDLSEPPPPGERRAAIDDKLARVPQLVMVYQVPEAGHPDNFVLGALGAILGGGESSRLYQRLVKEKELATSVSASAGRNKGPSLFQISAMLGAGKNPSEVETVIMEELARLKSDAVTANEMLRAQSAARRLAIGMRGSSLSRAIMLADSGATFDDPNRINTELPKRLAVTSEDVQRAAKKYFVDANKVVLTTMPAAPQRPTAKPPAGEE
jgi:predicted Zn-dependent peptidase